jgi:hypothetical protein
MDTLNALIWIGLFVFIIWVFYGVYLIIKIEISQRKIIRAYKIIDESKSIDKNLAYKQMVKK